MPHAMSMQNSVLRSNREPEHAEKVTRLVGWKAVRLLNSEMEKDKLAHLSPMLLLMREVMTRGMASNAMSCLPYLLHGSNYRSNST